MRHNFPARLGRGLGAIIRYGQTRRGKAARDMASRAGARRHGGGTGLKVPIYCLCHI